MSLKVSRIVRFVILIALLINPVFFVYGQQPELAIPFVKMRPPLAEDPIPPKMPFRTIHPGGVEYVSEGELGEKNSLYGLAPIPNGRTKLQRYENGKLIYTKQYSVDQNGLRKSADEGKKNKPKHFLFIDGSTAFGDGLADNETTTNWLDKKSNIYDAYAIGFLNYQYQHNWLQLQTKELVKKVKQKKGKAILIGRLDKLFMLDGQLSTLYAIKDFPNVKLNAKGKIEYFGNYQDTSGFFIKMLIEYCLPVAACARLLASFQTIDERLLRLGGIFFEDMDKMYREQFDVESFAVGWMGTEKEAKYVQQFTKVPIISLPATSEVNSHPTAEGAELIADFILNQYLAH